jgi:hypothetical protein
MRANAQPVRETLRENAKLRQRCAILVEVGKNLGRLYEGANVTATQKHYMETIIGAALWYLPTSKELWTGGISVQALADFQAGSGVAKPRLTEDHEYPRKVSGLELMRRAWQDVEPTTAMLELYLQKYGRYNYITPLENKVLVKFQKAHVFQDPSTAYARAGVQLVSISEAELRGVLNRDAMTIESCLARVSS